VFEEIEAEAARERQREREERRRAAAAGVEVKEEEETDEEEDYMGVGPLIEKLERQSAKYDESLDQFWEPTDTESDEDDERYCIVTLLYLYGGCVVFLSAFDAPVHLFFLPLIDTFL
jgi:hypothetical protein